MNEQVSETRVFHLGDLLSVTTGTLVSPRYMDGLCDILGYLLASAPDLDKLQATMAACRPYLLSRVPALSEVLTEDVSFESWRGWLEEQVSLYGEWHSVQKPLPGQIGLVG